MGELEPISGVRSEIREIEGEGRRKSMNDWESKRHGTMGVTQKGPKWLI